MSSSFITIHPENPQERLIRQVVEILRNQGVIVYPTDSGYALGCMLKIIISLWYVQTFPIFPSMPALTTSSSNCLNAILRVRTPSFCVQARRCRAA